MIGNWVSLCFVCYQKEKGYKSLWPFKEQFRLVEKRKEEFCSLCYACYQKIKGYKSLWPFKEQFRFVEKRI